MQPIKVERRNVDKRQNARKRDDWRVLGYAPGREFVRGRAQRSKSGRPSGWTIMRQLSLSLIALVLTGWLIISQNSSTSSSVSSSIWKSVDAVAEMAGLGVQQISLSGHRYSSDIDLFAVLSAHSGRSLIGVDVKGATDDLVKLAWVKSADIMRKFPDELVVRIEEQRPFAVWQLGDQYWLISQSGEKLAPIMKPRVGELAQISGAGANKKFAGLMSNLDGFGNIRSAISSYAYIGNRRWKLTLSSGVSVELPASRLRDALKILAGLMGDERIWTADIRSVDLRLSDRVSIARDRSLRVVNSSTIVTALGKVDRNATLKKPMETGTLSAADLAVPVFDEPAPGARSVFSNRRGG